MSKEKTLEQLLEEMSDKEIFDLITEKRAEIAERKKAEEKAEAERKAQQEKIDAAEKALVDAYANYFEAIGEGKKFPRETAEQFLRKMTPTIRFSGKTAKPAFDKIFWESIF